MVLTYCQTYGSAERPDGDDQSTRNCNEGWRRAELRNGYETRKAEADTQTNYHRVDPYRRRAASSCRSHAC
jgi:hypothetical protein